MKRISLAVTVVASCFVLGGQQTAQAYDPNAANNQQLNFPNSPTSLPSVNLGGFQNNSNYDPLFNPSLLTTPSSPLIPNNPLYPGVTNPVPGGRDRINPTLNPALNPNYSPGGYWDPTQPIQQRRWRLSVMSQDTNTGVRIHSVTPGGAANRAGLEAGDVIVAVNGYQVGYVGSQLYDCASEFDRSADQNGVVSMLVQDARQRQLVNVLVRLDQRLDTVNGVVSIPNRQGLAPNSVVTVELREVYNNQSSYVVNSRTIQNVINQNNIPFSLDFDTTQMKAGVQYYVYANCNINGIETHRVQSLIPVQQINGQIQQLNIQLLPVQASNNTVLRPNTNTMDQNQQVQTITGWYQNYYGVNPTQIEIANSLAAIQSGRSMRDVQLSLLASDRFYSLSGGNERSYIDRLHQALVGRPSRQAEMDYWLNRYVANNSVRYNFTREFMDAVGIY